MRSILRQSSRKPAEKLNILCSSVHERVQSHFAKAGHNCYLVHLSNFKDWDEKYAPIPKNFTLFNRSKDVHQIIKDVDYDVILSENRFGQWQFFNEIRKVYHIPMIQFEHTQPYSTWSAEQFKQMSQCGGDYNGFITEYSRDSWGYNSDNSVVIGHMVDTDIFCPDENVAKEKVIGSVVNDFINRNQPCGYDLWKDVTGGLPTKHVGTTPGLSEAAKNIDDLINHYRKSQIFINTSLISPIPCAVLEAAACGCAIVTTATCALPEYFQDEINCFMTNDQTLMRKRIKQLLDDPKLCKELGDNARKMVIEKCGEEQYIKKWNDLLYKAANKTFIG